MYVYLCKFVLPVLFIPASHPTQRFAPKNHDKKFSGLLGWQTAA
jgi:hypothetical protein